MDDKLIKILKELKNIQPDPNYSKRSRLLIMQSARIKATHEVDLRERKFQPTEILRFLSPAKLMMIVGVIILTLVVSGGIYYVNHNQTNQEDLIVKASEMNAAIQIKLNEIKYLLESENQSQIDQNKISAIQELLGKAANELKDVSASEGKNLDESLRKIKASQEILEQIDALLKQ